MAEILTDVLGCMFWGALGAAVVLCLGVVWAALRVSSDDWGNDDDE